MPNPANDPGPDPNEPDLLLHFPLRSDAEESDRAAAVVPPRAAGAGGWDQARLRGAWLAALLAIVVVGSAVAFLTDGGAASLVDGEAMQPEPPGQGQPEAEENVQEPPSAEPADATEIPGEAAESNDPAPASNEAEGAEVESPPAEGGSEATEEEVTLEEPEAAEESAELAGTVDRLALSGRTLLDDRSDDVLQAIGDALRHRLRWAAGAARWCVEHMDSLRALPSWG